MKVSTIGNIKENVQLLDTAVLRWLNSNPTDRIQQTLQDAHKKLERCSKMCDSPLRLAVLGEPDSGSVLLLSALLDTAEVIPGIAQERLENVLELRITPKTEEKPPRIKGASVVFLDDTDVWEIMNSFLQDLTARGMGGSFPKNIRSGDDLPKLEDALLSAAGKARDAAGQQAILNTLDYVLAVKHNQNVVLREQRHVSQLAKELVLRALSPKDRPDKSQGIEAFHQAILALHEEVGAFNINAEIKEQDLQAIFPLVYKVVIDMEAWCVPFGIEAPQASGPVSLLHLPEASAETVTARTRILCGNEIKDAHSVLLVLNGAKPDGSGINSVVAGKGAGDKSIVVANRFDELHAAPSEGAPNLYAQGFNKLISSAKTLASGKQQLYVCSATCYLLDAKAKRGNWNFGKTEWFGDNKRQAAYSAYKRNDADFKKLISQLEADKKGGPDFVQMKQALQRYVDGAGLSALRQDIVAFARERGERGIKDEIMKELRAAFKAVDEVSPSASGSAATPAVSSDATYRAQEFYRVLELAVADALPSGASDYKRLKLKDNEKDLVLWDIIETEITSQVACWPEWFAILNQSLVKKTVPTPATTASKGPQKVFSRYDKIKKAGGEVPAEFKAFNERFIKTAEALNEFAVKKIAEAALYSVQRFEGHSDYQAACQQLQDVLHMDKLSEMEQGLPIVDAWQPTRMVEDAVVPEILERISDEVDDLKNIRYPYDGDKPCFWNLALIVRVQVQLVKTLRDKVSRLIAAAENQFNSFFVSEVLRAEILPLVRSCLNDTNFLAQVAKGEVGQVVQGETETMGQAMRAALEKVRQQLSLGGGSLPPASVGKAPAPNGKAPSPVSAGKAPAGKSPAPAPNGKAPAPSGKSPTTAPKKETPQDNDNPEQPKEGFDEW